jgi:hypothetical protein
MAVIGCRYRELEVDDFNPDSGGLLLIRFSKTSKPRHIALTAEAAAFFTQLRAGRSPTEVMLQRADGRLSNNISRVHRRRGRFCQGRRNWAVPAGGPIGLHAPDCRPCRQLGDGRNPAKPDGVTV